MTQRPVPWTSALLMVCALTLMASLLWPPALAAVVLIRFEAAAQTDNTIRVTWQTATELDTVGFNLYRAQSPGGPWGNPVFTTEAQTGGVTGATYVWIDTQVVQAVLYYYKLVELTVGGGAGQEFGPVQAGVNLSANTPTSTATPTGTLLFGTSTATRTPTRTPTLRFTLTWTPIMPPTVTRRFTNTPAPFPTATATPPRPPGFGPSSTPSPLPPAVLASPTAGPAPLATLPGQFLPAPTSTRFLLLPTTSPTPTPDLAATETAAAFVLPTSTRELTPVVFAARGDGTRILAAATPLPTLSPTTGLPAGRATRTVLIMGGVAIGLAAALAVAALLLWRARGR